MNLVRGIAGVLAATALVLVLVLALALGAGTAGAIQPDEILPDPADEARAREVSKDLRCLVCQNQSIDDSDAELARDLRLLVRERVAAGDSNEEVVNYVVSRYGDFVLLKPPFKTSTYLLWLGPAVILAIGLGAVTLFYRRRTGAGMAGEPAALSDGERARLDRLLDDEPRR
jgi:cytochrome c-type biogenesis protein CcmH